MAVALLEKGEVCSGCSFGNACLITPSHAVPLPAPGVIRQALKWMLKEDSPLLIRARPDFRLAAWLLQFAGYCRTEPMLRGIPVLRDLCRASLTLFEEVARAEDLQFHYERRGILYVSSTDAGFEKTKHSAELLARHGFESRALTGPETHALEPAVLETVRGALYYPEDAHGDSYLFVTGLARILPKLGVAVHTGVSVSGLRAESPGKVTVATSRGEFAGRHAVIASGSWSTQLTRQLGIRIPIQPAKGYSVTMARPEGGPKIPVGHNERKMVVTPIGDRLRFAGTLEFAGMDLRMNETRAEAAVRSGREILHPLREPRNLERWCGLRPCTPDGIPIVDRLPGHPHVLLASGHAMLGYTLGPVTGKLVSEMIAGTPPSLPLEPLRLTRFR